MSDGKSDGKGHEDVSGKGRGDGKSHDGKSHDGKSHDGQKYDGMDGESHNISHIDHAAIIAHELHSLESDWIKRYARLLVERDELHEELNKSLSAHNAAIEAMQTEVDSVHQDITKLEMLLTRIVASAVELIKEHQTSK